MSKLKLNFSFKKRSVSFYITFTAVLLAFIGGLIFFIIDKSVFQGKTNFTDTSYLTLIFLLVGSIIGLAGMFTDISAFNILASFLYAAGTGQQLYLMMFPWADIFKGVPFFVSDKISVELVYNTFLIFMIIFAIATVGSIVSCFLFKPTGSQAEKLDSLNNPA